MFNDVFSPGVDGEDLAAVGDLGRPVLSHSHLHGEVFGELCDQSAQLLHFLRGHKNKHY